MFLTSASLLDPPGTGTAAERERLEWISRDLARHGMCPHGWLLVERTPLRHGQEGLLGYPVHEIHYRGRCAPAPEDKASAE